MKSNTALLSKDENLIDTSFFESLLHAQDNSKLSKKTGKPIKKNIDALTHPKHYMMHKYWGRKAHNVVSDYISHYTNPGDIVLDPFMGSGVSVIESIKLGRQAIGIDLNPISTFIVNNTISKVDLKKFTTEYKKISNELRKEYGYLYDTTCPECGEVAEIETAIWKNDKLSKIRLNCKKHGVVIKDPNTNDNKHTKSIITLFKELDAANNLNYPQDKIMKYVKRNGRECIKDLFTERALILLSALKNKILAVKNDKIQNLLFLCFTSMLPNVSRMLPGDEEKATYKSGWVISKFWTPQIHTERNIFSCFALRFNTILKGKEELCEINSSLAKVLNKDSTNLRFIPNNSVDYIFTDPPYGESISYFALSHFWNSWLDNPVDYSNEIIIDPYREKRKDDFDERIKKAYKEMYRVLKPEHYLSFTFHNRDLNVWKSILEGCLDAGFELANIVMQSQAVSSGTQGINRKNTLKGDFVYNFKKTTTSKKVSRPQITDAEEFICEKLCDFLLFKKAASSSELYEYIIPIIAKNHAYMDSNNKVVNIENLINKKFDYVSMDDGYKWVIKR